MAESIEILLTKYDSKWAEYILSEKGKQDIYFAIKEFLSIYLSFLFKYDTFWEMRFEATDDILAQAIKQLLIQNKILLVEILSDHLINSEYFTNIENDIDFSADIVEFYIDKFISFLIQNLKLSKKSILNNTFNFKVKINSYLNKFIKEWNSSSVLPRITGLQHIQEVSDAIAQHVKKYEYLYVCSYEYMPSGIYQLTYLIGLVQLQKLYNKPYSEIINIISSTFTSKASHITSLRFLIEITSNIIYYYRIYILIYAFLQEYDITMFEDWFKLYLIKNIAFQKYVFPFILFVVYYYYFPDKVVVAKDIFIDHYLKHILPTLAFSDIVQLVLSGKITSLPKYSDTFYLIGGLAHFFRDIYSGFLINSNKEIFWEKPYENIIYYIIIYAIFLEPDDIPIGESIFPEHDFATVLFSKVVPKINVDIFYNIILKNFKPQIQVIDDVYNNSNKMIKKVNMDKHIYFLQLLKVLSRQEKDNKKIWEYSKDFLPHNLQKYLYIHFMTDKLTNFIEDFIENPNLTIDDIVKYFLHPVFKTTYYNIVYFIYFFDLFGIILLDYLDLIGDSNDIQEYYKEYIEEEYILKRWTSGENLYKLCFKYQQKLDVSLFLDILLNKVDIIKSFIKQKIYLFKHIGTLLMELYEIDKDRDEHKEIYEKLVSIYLCPSNISISDYKNYQCKHIALTYPSFVSFMFYWDIFQCNVQQILTFNTEISSYIPISLQKNVSKEQIYNQFIHEVIPSFLENSNIHGARQLSYLIWNLISYIVKDTQESPFEKLIDLYLQLFELYDYNNIFEKINLVNIEFNYNNVIYYIYSLASDNKVTFKHAITLYLIVYRWLFYETNTSSTYHKRELYNIFYFLQNHSPILYVSLLWVLYKAEERGNTLLFSSIKKEIDGFFPMQAKIKSEKKYISIVKQFILPFKVLFKGEKLWTRLYNECHKGRASFVYAYYYNKPVDKNARPLYVQLSELLMLQQWYTSVRKHYSYPISFLQFLEDYIELNSLVYKTWNRWFPNFPALDSNKSFEENEQIMNQVLEKVNELAEQYKDKEVIE